METNSIGIVNLTDKMVMINNAYISPEPRGSYRVSNRTIGYVDGKPVQVVTYVNLPKAEYGKILVLPKEVALLINRSDVYYPEYVALLNQKLVSTYDRHSKGCIFSEYKCVLYADMLYKLSKDIPDNKVVDFLKKMAETA